MNYLLAIFTLLSVATQAATLTVTWPATGVTNRVMLNGEQVALTAGTNWSGPVLPGRHTVAIIAIGKPIYYSRTLEVMNVPRWGVESSPTLRNPVWTPEPMATGQRVTGTNRVLRTVIRNELEAVRVLRWANQEALKYD